MGRIGMLLLAGVIGFLPRTIFSLDEGHSTAVKHMQIKESDLGTMGLVALVLFVGLILHVLLYAYKNKKDKENKKVPVGNKEQRKSAFEQQASDLGFNAAETKILKQIVEKEIPATQGQLLESKVGREQLLDKLEKAIQRRGREIEVLRHLEQHLERMGDSQYRERQYLRVGAAIPITVWPREKNGARGQAGREDSKTVPGQLIDLGEGGAALSADIELGPGKILEFSTADKGLALPILAASIVGVEEREESLVFHSQFLKPPRGVLRQAVMQLQRRSLRK